MKITTIDFGTVYHRFDSPIAGIDCGDLCAPYNEGGVPFCCDLRHAVPSAYQAEWEYLRANTDLWRLWEVDNPAEMTTLRKQTPEGQVLIACQGYSFCQREFRSLVCRAFPFFPYFNRQGDFIGLSYYWEYEERCWVISHLEVVSPTYRKEFIAAYDWVFEHFPEERRNFQHLSTVMRRSFGRRKRAIPLLHRNGHNYKVTPRTGRLRRLHPEKMPKFGPYAIAARMPFPDEEKPQRFSEER